MTANRNTGAAVGIAKLLKTASPAASRLAALALAGLVLKTLVLNRWPAPAAPMYDLGILIEAVLTSIVASYIFYLVVVHLKELRDRGAVAPYILRHTRRVVGEGDGRSTRVRHPHAVDPCGLPGEADRTRARR